MSHPFKEENVMYHKPIGLCDEECYNLHGCQAVLDDGTKIIVTYWKPSYEDLVALNAGEGIYLTVFASKLPAISIDTVNPFSRLLNNEEE